VDLYLSIYAQLVSDYRELKGKLSTSAVGDSEQTRSGSDKDHLISQLKQQNSDLHDVIRQMRAELEDIAEPSNPISVSYVQYMEREVQQLKGKNHELESKIQSKLVSAEKPPRSPSTERTKAANKDSEKAHATSGGIHMSHVIALSDTIATLQREKNEMAVQLSQANTKTRELEQLVREHKEKVSHK